MHEAVAARGLVQGILVKNDEDLQCLHPCILAFLYMIINVASGRQN